MRVQITMKRVQIDYAIIEVRVPDGRVDLAKRKARDLARREPARFCDGEDLPIEITNIECFP